MKHLANSDQHNAFVPEQFEVVSDFDDVVIDPRIASDIANAVFARNNPSLNHRNNQPYCNDTPFIVDARWEGYSAWPNDSAGIDEETGRATIEGAYRVHVPFAVEDASTDVVNQTFAWGLQRLLDREEQDSRLGQIGSSIMLGASAAMTSIPSIAFWVSSEGTSPVTRLTLGAVNGIAGFRVFGPICRDTVAHMGRNLVTKPNSFSNKRHMRNTIQHIGQLGLEPVLYEIT